MSAINVAEMATKLCCLVGYDGEVYFDLTPYIVVPSFNVQLKPEYYEWEDMNHEVHRRFKRYTISGNFKVLIDDPEILADFTNQFNNAMSYPLFVIPSNISNMGVESIEDYIWDSAYAFNDFAFSYSIPSIIPYLGRKKVDPIDITISNKIKQVTDWSITFAPVVSDDPGDVVELPRGNNDEIIIDK